MINSAHVAVHKGGNELTGLERTWALCNLAKHLPVDEWEFHATEYVSMPWSDDSDPAPVRITSPDQIDWEEEFR